MIILKTCFQPTKMIQPFNFAKKSSAAAATQHKGQNFVSGPSLEFLNFLQFVIKQIYV
jgi:hypothetical protein